MLYQKPKFSVPATTPTKTPCKVHHFVNGKCLRCPEKIVAMKTSEIPDGASKAVTVPTTSEGEE